MKSICVLFIVCMIECRLCFVAEPHYPSIEIFAVLNGYASSPGPRYLRTGVVASRHVDVSVVLRIDDNAVAAVELPNLVSLVRLRIRGQIECRASFRRIDEKHGLFFVAMQCVCPVAV